MVTAENALGGRGYGVMDLVIELAITLFGAALFVYLATILVVVPVARVGARWRRGENLTRPIKWKVVRRQMRWLDRSITEVTQSHIWGWPRQDEAKQLRQQIKQMRAHLDTIEGGLRGR